MDGTDGTRQPGGRDTATVGAGADRVDHLGIEPTAACSGFSSHRVVSSWERPARIDRIALIEARYLWARISASPSGPRKMERTVLGLSIVANVGLDMPCSPA
jgi:hypothetical protein